MKAILVIDMPEKCSNCKLSQIYQGYLECSVYGKQLITDVKPNWCPLKPLPERKKVIPIFTHNIENAKLEIANQNKGFNDCIDEILGEEE